VAVRGVFPKIVRESGYPDSPFDEAPMKFYDRSQDKELPALGLTVIGDMGGHGR
jgi:hypothetical protein